MKDKLIKTIREVPIADKTYPEYVEALADHILAEGILEKSIQYRIIKKACNDGRKAAAREIFEEIEQEIKNHGITYAQRKIAELKKKYESEKDNGN